MSHTFQEVNLEEAGRETVQNVVQNSPTHLLPISVYDIELRSADGQKKSILSEQKGKVTLLFNVAAGCGNIPQHSIIEELNQRYRKVDDFEIIAIVVDDFVCHGYPEFQEGINKYIEENNLEITPGQVSEKYARENFGVTYQFSELTNGRHDKHKYSADYVPGKEKVQEQHPLWSYLTGAYAADMQENGVPYHLEEVSWSDARSIIPHGKIGFPPLRGNFEKFLIDRTGRRVKRYSNGFLLGERDSSNNMFPWLEEKYLENGKRDHKPKTHPREGLPWPTPTQRYGIDLSLDMISKDIDAYLAESA
jgi:glutathione peroxidase-family protein